MEIENLGNIMFLTAAFGTVVYIVVKIWRLFWINRPCSREDDSSV